LIDQFILNDNMQVVCSSRG